MAHAENVRCSKQEAAEKKHLNHRQPTWDFRWPVRMSYTQRGLFNSRNALGWFFICTFVSGLFGDAFSISEYVVSSGR